MDLFVWLWLLSPALLSLGLMVAAGIKHLVRRRRDRWPCRDHMRVLVEVGEGLVELCQVCDAGDVVDGRWQFAPPVDADHTL